MIKEIIYYIGGYIVTEKELHIAIKVLRHIDNLNEDPDIDYSMSIVIDLLRNILIETL